MKNDSTETFLRMAENLPLTGDGKDYVRQCVLNQGPSRKVESKVGNVVTKFVNLLTNVRETTESLVEYAAALSYEMSLSVDYYASQPPPIYYQQTVHRWANGKESVYASPTQYTPDFLVVDDGQVFVDEWKTEAHLHKLAETHPHRFQNHSGAWKCPERDEEFSRFGMRYRLRSDKELPLTLRNNVEYLQTYLDAEAKPVPKAALGYWTLRQHSSTSRQGETGPPSF